MKHIPIFIAFSLLIFLGAYVAIKNDSVKKENRRLVNENVSLRNQNFKLTEFINGSDETETDTIVVNGVKYDVVGVNFNDGVTMYTFYKFVYVGSGKK